MSKKTVKNKNLGRTLRLTQLSVITAILLILGFTKLGYLPIIPGSLEITLNVIPVAIAATVLGPAAGAICGLIFGLTSFWQCFGMSVFGAELLNVNPICTFILCVVPRILAGLLPGLIFKAIDKKVKNNIISCAIASISCPLFNTLLFVGSFILLFGKTNYFADLYGSSGATNIIVFFILFIGFNGIGEAVAGLIISTPVSKALLTANKKLLKI